MTITVYTAAGTKKGTVELPSVFGSRINTALMHQALMRQMSNRRKNIAHTKTRGEVTGSTKKVYQQKGTGRARRGPVRSPLLRGGGKTFGSRNDRNYIKDMPKSMRRAALASCLAWQAKRDAIFALESYPDEIKTKTFIELMKKLPLDIGRRVLFVIPGAHKGLQLSAKNVPGVRVVDYRYLNPEDLTVSRKVVFLTETLEMVQDMLTKERSPMKEEEEAPVEKVKKEKKVKVAKKPAAKKAAAKKTSKKAS